MQRNQKQIKNMENKDFNFTQEQIEEMSKYVLTSLQRIVPQITDVKLEIKSNYKNLPYINVKSSSFQTFPSLFKEVWIEGVCYPFFDEKKNAFNLNFAFDYRWVYYNGGFNGTELGRMTLKLYVDDDYSETIVSSPFTYTHIH